MRVSKTSGLLSLLLLAACSASPKGAVSVGDASVELDGDVASDAETADLGEVTDSGDPTSPSLTITSPTSGRTYGREDVVAGRWAARVPVTVETTGAIVRVTVALATLPTQILAEDTAAPFELDVAVPIDGTFEFLVRGYDASGALLAMDTVTGTFAAPADSSCRAMLDALPLTWSASSAMGVPDAVFVQPMVGGVSFRYTESATAGRMLVDCSLGVRIAWLAEILEARGVVEAEHIGTYNYRCIGGGTPETRPGCTLSQHAQSKAIDLHAFTLESGDHFDTVDDWEIRADGQPICGGTFDSEGDEFLRDLACEMHGLGMFNIILTPDYNSAHRNHFHVDLTEGSDYLGASALGLDPAVPGLGDTE
jgi:hypothetical protein